jgi:hypothetical protein
MSKKTYQWVGPGALTTTGGKMIAEGHLVKPEEISDDVFKRLEENERIVEIPEKKAVKVRKEIDKAERAAADAAAEAKKAFTK